MDDKLINILGGHFETGALENETGRYIDYIANYERKATQVIEFGKNLLDITQCVKTEDVATRIIPLGKKDNDGNYLTIKDINNGLDYVQDDAAVALFGVIEKTVEFEDVTIAENLLKKDALEEYINSTVSIELSAADLHNLDVNIEAFRIGDNVRVISRPHGLDRYFLLSKLSLALDSVSSCSMTLGATFKTFTQRQIENEKQLNATVNNTAISVKEVKQEVQAVNDNVVVLSEKVNSEYVTTKTFENYKTAAEKSFAKSSDLTDYLKTQDANNLFINKESYENLLKRVENLENKESDEGGIE